uniref:Methyltransferase domain-containing protein n=1 Tax=Candidatus Kentrum sp. MB TaxID=2138164 RepID=A0A450XGM7_9GAMM|nr:MAG: Methyltransferase domain-containing protein [Candidatus Kentron sp. MB]VFK28457.1 MAG: Methyltransferase domain-containing protein [Candidatus Kentron sp. MB]VFK74261.1 MAG: Methyltransferase domain-containing protein [Candidatus Kentron sp. MB]
MKSPNRSNPGKCPACGFASTHLVDWEFSGLGDSIFNYTAHFNTCSTCGLVYIHNIDDKLLETFYTEECGYFAKAHFEVTAPANREKFAFYGKVLAEQGIRNVDMVDVGCGRGGFVTWLVQSGWNGVCCGVDVDARSMPIDSEMDKGPLFLDGDALNLPLDNRSSDLLTYFHVLEHIHDTHGLLREAARVLKPDGYILIEVPDAENYSARPIGSAFWISIREHIHHFTANALVFALNSQGFSVQTVLRQTLPTPEFSYPSLMILARKTHASRISQSPAHMDVSQFVLASKTALRTQAEQVNRLADGKQLSIWGCSAELFSLLPLLDIQKMRICDSSQLKQTTHVRGLPIEDPTSLPMEGSLVVAPYLYGAEIKRAALRLGWPEASIYRLQ